jgi:hypothetical protein
MSWLRPAEAASEGGVEIKAASRLVGEQFEVLLETRHRRGAQEKPEEVLKHLKLKEKAGRALHAWAQVSEQKLNIVSQSYSRDRNVIEIDEAQALWELLDQVRLDISRYVEDPDSLLEGYEPLQRAAAPEVLEPFWDRWQTVFDILGAYRDTLTVYLNVRRQQPISEVRNFERDRRTDSREIRAKMREFVIIARPLMQALIKL